MRIGIFGGSFNPVHEGHVKLAETALEELNLAKVIFVPSAGNPLKAGARHAVPLLPAPKRLALLKRAVKGKRGLSVSGFEIRRKPPTYTIDTLRHFKKKFRPADQLYFLAGADVAKGLKRWKDFGRILKLCRFVVASRPGFHSSRLPKGVSRLVFEAIPVSSTQIRKRLLPSKAN